jgi:anti-sigma factor RsiW
MLWISIAVVAFLLLGGAVTGLVIQQVHSQQVAAAASKAAKVKAAKVKEARREAEAAEAAQEVKDTAERAKRAAAVVSVQASIKKMAEDDVAKGVLDGPVLGVNCNPVNGGSTDDLTDVTTAFDCFVGNKDNGDGTQSGYFFNATMNWSTGSYTYGLGKSR